MYYIVSLIVTAVRRYGWVISLDQCVCEMVHFFFRALVIEWVWD